MFFWLLFYDCSQALNPWVQVTLFSQTSCSWNYKQVSPCKVQAYFRKAQIWAAWIPKPSCALGRFPLLSSLSFLGLTHCSLCPGYASFSISGPGSPVPVILILIVCESHQNHALSSTSRKDLGVAVTIRLWVDGLCQSSALGCTCLYRGP